jgi:hypothetical protein
VAVRDEEEKMDNLPALRKVPHALAAGWGGIGKLDYCMDIDVDSLSLAEVSYRGPEESMIPSFSLAEADVSSTSVVLESSFEHLVLALNQRYPAEQLGVLNLNAIKDLSILYTDQTLTDYLEALYENNDYLGITEKEFVVLFLTMLEKSDAGSLLNRNIRRMIRKARMELQLEERIVSLIENQLQSFIGKKG